ncbi:MAG: purine phosphorylase [Puniceicoccaceae bacterium]|nr:MAG: purine phosphorylase [Puniceicoccaceae bacterium]
MKPALISGTSIAKSGFFSGWETVEVETPHGAVTLLRRGEAVVLNRHGFGRHLPPHSINHRANIAALKQLGCDTVVSLNSVGSLRPDLPPGSLVSCEDYVSFHPATYFDDRPMAMAPVLSNALIPALVAAHEDPILTGKVYIQTRGPRFETRAEVRVLRSWGDVVGMTLAHEADLCQEIGLACNSLCVVDNFAHGLEGAQPLGPEAFRWLVAANQERVDRLLATVMRVVFGPSAAVRQD